MGYIIFFPQKLTTLGKKAFENMGKGENAGNQHILLFPQCFPTFPNKNFLFGVDC